MVENVLKNFIKSSGFINNSRRNPNVICKNKTTCITHNDFDQIIAFNISPADSAIGNNGRTSSLWNRGAEEPLENLVYRQRHDALG